jgi:peroxiredoxin
MEQRQARTALVCPRAKTAFHREADKLFASAEDCSRLISDILPTSWASPLSAEWGWRLDQGLACCRLTRRCPQPYNSDVTTNVAPEFRGKCSLKDWRRVLCFAAMSLTFACGSVHALERLQHWPGRALQPFLLDSLDGSTVNLADHRGAPVLIHYFATWCILCRRELPALGSLASRFPAPHLKIFAISVAEPDVRVRRFFQTLAVPFPVLLDRDRAVAKLWQVDVLPTTILLDDRLEPRVFVEGEFDWDSEAAANAVKSLAIPIDIQEAQTPIKEDTP